MAAAVRALVLADTHVSTGGSRRMPRAVRDALAEVDVVLHAGDVVENWVLDELRAAAPVHAVLGNNDHTLRGALPDRLELTLGGVPIAIVHDSGARAGRERRMQRWFPAARVVIFGHSHMPMNVRFEDLLLFNPGSSTWKRTAPSHTFGVLTLADGEVTRAEIVDC